MCEPGKGYVAADTAQQLNEEFLAKLKAAGIGTVIRYYDWADETLPGKTLTARELALIAKVGYERRRHLPAQQRLPLHIHEEGPRHTRCQAGA